MRAPYILLIIIIFILFSYFYLSQLKLTRFYRSKKVDVQGIEDESGQSKYVKWTLNRIRKSSPNKLEVILQRWMALVKSPYAKMDIAFYFIIEGLLAGLGFYSGYVLLNNLVLAILLTVVGFWLGIILLERQIQESKRDKDEKLLLVISNLTAVYMRGDNFVMAVEETLESIPQPLYDIFVIFLYKIKYYGFENTHKAMEDLADDIDNYYFTELIHLIQQAENGETGLKYAIESIPETYRDYIYINMQYRKTIEDINLHFAIRLLLLPIAIGFVYLLGEEYFEKLVEHFLGKTVLLVIFVIYVIGIYVFRKNNKDITFDI